jgi:hypothetical protein
LPPFAPSATLSRLYPLCASFRSAGIGGTAQGGGLVKVRLVLAMALLAGAAGLAVPAPAASQARGTQPREAEAGA